MTTTAPVRPAAVGAVSQARETIDGVATVAPTIPLVGRAAELDALRAAWQRAVENEAVAVITAGDAGIGKTRLVTELANEVTASGGLVLVGHCLGLGQAAPPFLPVLEVLTQLRDGHGSAPLAAAAGELLQTDVAGDQVRLFDGVHSVLLEAARTAPLLLVVEDLHWSDPSTRDLLLFLLARLGTGRILVVLTYRSDDLNRAHPLRPWLAGVARMRGVDRLDVEPLDRADAVAFVRALLPGDAASDSVILDVAKRSEGNAFFAEELTNAAANGGRAEISDILASVLLDRIERLSNPAQRVVRAAAIIGQRDLWASSLERLVASDAVGVSPDAVEGALRECVQSHVLVVTPGGAFAFRHALLREAVLADLLPGERSRLHAAYLPVLEADRPQGWQAAQAFHASRAGDLALALRAHLGAATDACNVAAHGDALAHLELALELWAAVAEPEEAAGVDELALVLRACDEATASGRVDRALSYARSGVAMADAVGTVLQQAGARRRWAKLLYSISDWREAERQINQAWALLEDQPATAERAWVMSTMSFGEATPDRRVLAERAIAEARTVGARGPEADALISLAFLLQHEGDVEAAVERLRDAREKARSAGADDTELRAYFNMAILRFDHGQLAEAERLATEGSQVAARHGRSWAGYGREVNWLLQVVALARGEFRVVADRADRWLVDVSQGARDVMHQTRALAAVWLGDWEQVEADVAVIAPPEVAAAMILNGGIEEPMAASAVLQSWLWRGRYEQVIDAITTAQVAPTFPDELVEVRVGALLLAAHGELARRERQANGGQTCGARAAAVRHAIERVERVAKEGVPRGQSIGPEGHLWLLRARAEAARALGDDDTALWREVVEAAGYGELPQVSIARWRLGESLLEHGDPAGAAELVAAHEAARGMAAAPLLAAIEAVARRFKVALPTARTSGAALLTPRERSVLELVAHGLTNRAIGAELFISEKTVSVHLTRVMAKLGAASRTEAVAVAMSRGLI